MSQYTSLNAFLRSAVDTLSAGPVALIFAEDDVALDVTLRHHLSLGFKRTIVFALPEFEIAADVAEKVLRVDYNMRAADALETALNSVIKAAGDIWLYYCYNSEFLFYPFCESRSVGEMLEFNAQERRESMVSYVVDLYSGDLDKHPNAVSIEDAHIDKSGYYALVRKDRWNNDLDRQLDFFGGLRWRFEEHIPAPRRRIDRVALFRVKKGLVFQPDHTFNEQEYNTYACPWHNSLTATVCSFRTAKALKRNPGSTFDIHTFKWHNSAPFSWHSQQLLDLGLMEPGQWF